MTDEALDLKIGFPTGSFCLALLANVLPATPGDLERWWEVELKWAINKIIKFHSQK